MKRILLIALLMVGSTLAHAEIMFDLSTGYSSRTVDNATLTTMENHLFAGMAVGVKDQLYFGLNATMARNGNSDGGSSTEFGPRINYYFNADKTFLVMLAYNPFVSFSGNASGNSDFSATSYLAGVGYETKVNTNFYLGAALMYHSTTAKNKSTNTESTVSTTMPTINFSLRFK